MGQIEISAQLGQHIARAGARDSKLRPLFRDRCDKHFIMRPFRLQPFLKPGGDAVSSARCGVHQEMIFCQTHGNAVISEEAQLIHHQPVAAFPNIQG